MDLALFARVIWRSKLLVFIGLVAACALAVLGMARVSFAHGFKLTYRQPVLYASDLQLLVTQNGFPEGRSVFNTAPATLPSGHVILPKFADPTRFTSLAVLYSQLIMGTKEQTRVFGSSKPPRNEKLLAQPLPSPGGASGFLPVVQITGIGPSPSVAMHLATRAASTFTADLIQTQNATSVPVTDRVILSNLLGPETPKVFQGRKKTRSIFAFAIVLLLTIGAAFARENIRQRRAAAGTAEDPREVGDRDEGVPVIQRSKAASGES